MPKKTTGALKRPPGLNPADKAALSRILKKARAAKAYYAAANPKLLDVKRSGVKARGRKGS